MNRTAPHYLLFSQSAEREGNGHWRFVLEALDGTDRLSADDAEPELRGERLELFTVVRGLEALDQPSRVTLVTASPYVREGIRYGLPQWRRNGWRWECFGRMVPVKNRDLWRRVDRALQFHRLECRTLRLDPPHPPGPPSAHDRSGPRTCETKRGLTWLFGPRRACFNAPTAGSRRVRANAPPPEPPMASANAATAGPRTAHFNATPPGSRKVRCDAPAQPRDGPAFRQRLTRLLEALVPRR